MGYTYPELVDNPANSTLIANIKAQYSDAATPKARSKRQDNAPVPTKGRLYLAEITIPIFGFSDGEGSSTPYNVHTFLGDVPSDPKLWLTSESYVAMTSTTGGLHMDTDQSTTIIVDMTAALERNGIELDETHTIEYLKENLHWRLGLVSYPFNRDEYLKLMRIVGRR